MLARQSKILITQRHRKKLLFFLQINTPDDEGILKKIYNNYN